MENALGVNRSEKISPKSYSMTVHGTVCRGQEIGDLYARDKIRKSLFKKKPFTNPHTKLNMSARNVLALTAIFAASLCNHFTTACDSPVTLALDSHSTATTVEVSDDLSLNLVTSSFIHLCDCRRFRLVRSSMCTWIAAEIARMDGW